MEYVSFLFSPFQHSYFYSSHYILHHSHLDFFKFYIFMMIQWPEVIKICETYSTIECHYIPLELCSIIIATYARILLTFSVLPWTVWTTLKTNPLLYQSPLASCHVSTFQLIYSWECLLFYLLLEWFLIH